MPQPNYLRRVGLASAIVLACATSALAERVQGTFKELEPEATRYILVLQDGKRYALPTKVHDQYRQHFREGGSITAGKPITFDVNGAKEITSIVIEAAGPVDQAMRVGILKEKNLETYQITLMDETRLSVRRERLNKDALLVFQFSKRGTRLKLVLEGGHVVDLAKAPRAGEDESKEVSDVLSRSRNNDTGVQIRTKKGGTLTYKLVQIKPNHLVVSPRIQGSNPPRYEGSFRVARSEIIQIINPHANNPDRVQKKGPNKTNEKDAFEAENAVVGDIVAIGFYRGQIVSLTDKEYVLRSWRNGRWEDAPKPEPRSKAKNLTHKQLASQHTLQLADGELEYTVLRSRKAVSGGLTFEVALSHTSKQTILTDVKLRFELSTKPCMDPKQKPDKVETTLITVPLFAGQRHSLRHEVNEEAYVDGRVEIELFPRNQRKITSKEARRHLIAALGGSDLQALSGVYRAAAVNRDRPMCHFMISRLLELQAELQDKQASSRVKAHELELRTGLDGYGAMAPKLIIDTLLGLDRQLKAWGLRNNQIQQVSLPAKERPQPYKRKLIRLLATLEHGLDPASAGARLFDVYVRRTDDFKEEIVAAYRKRPKEAVASLLSIAIDIRDRTRAEKATVLLRELGEPILEELFNALQKKGLDPTDAREAWRKRTVEPPKLVASAVTQLVELEYKQVAQELDAQVEEARTLATAHDFAKAITLVREVLEREPKHSEAKELLPEVLVQQAMALKGEGKRGESALALEEAYELLKGPAKIKAGNPMAELLVQSAQEALTSTVMRTKPHDAAEAVMPVKMGDVFDTKDENTDWLRVELEDKREGYLRKGLAVPAGKQDKSRIVQTEVPYSRIKGMLDKAETFSPSIAPRAKEVLGRLSAREGTRRYLAGDFKGALAFFDTARELTPDDPRLDVRWKCWIKANTAPLVGVFALLAFGVGLVIMQLFARPKKVKFSGEYEHYGAERNRRERDLEAE